MLEVRDLVVRFGEATALDGFDLAVADRTVAALIGPSGSGKSTLLRVIAGLEQPHRGDVRWDDESILEVPPHRRDFGMMFQDYALFPHRTVAQNVAFGLRMRRLPSDDIATQTEAALDLVGLTGYGGRSVGTLSGGEQQRVALARTLAPAPRLVLLDEPLGSLDRALRERLVEEMRAIFESVGATALYVTHDRDEAFAIAERVAVIDRGRIIAEGTPQELWNHPPTLRAADLVGVEHRLSGDGVANASVDHVSFRGGSYRVVVHLDDGTRKIASSTIKPETGDRVRVTGPI
jgi:ABC-type Fe3+/spermidine/putrescine transport system ATPase subunit